MRRARARAPRRERRERRGCARRALEGGERERYAGLTSVRRARAYVCCRSAHIRVYSIPCIHTRQKWCAHRRARTRREHARRSRGSQEAPRRTTGGRRRRGAPQAGAPNTTRRARTRAASARAATACGPRGRAAARRQHAVDVALLLACAVETQARCVGGPPTRCEAARARCASRAEAGELAKGVERTAVVAEAELSRRRTAIGATPSGPGVPAQLLGSNGCEGAARCAG